MPNPSPSITLLRYHGATLGGMAGIAWRTLLRAKPPAVTDEAPLHQVIKPPADQLVDAYVQWAGGTGRYDTTLPPHMVSQWGLAPVSKLLLRTRYPLARVINQGVTLRINGALPRGEPLHLRTRFDTLEERDGMARVTVAVSTGTASQPDLVDTLLHMAFPLPGQRKEKKARPAEPERAWQLAGEWSAAKRDGLSFALLTGDFNPIHWIAAAGRASPFGQTVLHGFGMLVRSYEQLGAQSLAEMDVRFLKPVPLPSGTLRVEHTAPDTQGEHQLRLRGAQDTLHLAGRYRTHTAGTP